MPYQQNVPLAANRINDTQPTILGNFQAINAFVNVNHVGFNLADAGKHAVVNYVSQGTFPANDPVAFGVTEAGLYNLQYNGAPEIFVRKSSAAPGVLTSIPMTASQKIVNGWSYLPSGLLIKWGYVNMTGAPVPYPAGAGIPVFNNILTAYVTPYTGTAGAWTAVIRAITVNNITVDTYPIPGATAPVRTNCVCNYLVIGY